MQSDAARKTGRDHGEPIAEAALSRRHRGTAEIAPRENGGQRRGDRMTWQAHRFERLQRFVAEFGDGCAGTRWFGNDLFRRQSVAAEQVTWQ